MVDVLGTDTSGLKDYRSAMHEAPREGPHPVDRHVGRRVAQRRLDLNLTQSDLARALGLTFQQIQKYEKGANRISASKLWEITHFLRTDIGAFFEGLEPDQNAVEPDSEDDRGPETRYTIEISRLATRLSRSQQKLMLDLAKSMLR